MRPTALGRDMRATFWLRAGVGTTVGLATGVALLAFTAPVYAAQASVLVEPVGVNLRTEAELVRSTQTTADANARLTADHAPPTTGGRLAAVEEIPGTSVLVIVFEAGTAEAARAGAMAFAEAYLAGRQQAAQAAVGDQIEAVLLRLDDVRTQLDGVNGLITALPGDAPELEALRAS